MADVTLEALSRRGPHVPAAARVRRRCARHRRHACAARPTPIPRRSGPSRPARCCTGTRTSPPRASGSCRSRSGSPAAGSTSRTTAWTATSPTGTATRSRSCGRASRATRRSISYGELLAEVGRTANALKALGVERGDRVAIYMGMVPGAADRDARLRPHRRRALGRVRRVHRRLAARPHQRRRGARARHRRRRVAPRAASSRSRRSPTRRWPRRRRSRSAWCCAAPRRTSR